MKKNYVRLFALLLCAVMLLSMTACGGSEKEEKGGAVNGIRPGLQRPEMPAAQGFSGLRATTKYGAVFGALVPSTVP